MIVSSKPGHTSILETLIICHDLTPTVHREVNFDSTTHLSLYIANKVSCLSSLNDHILAWKNSLNNARSDVCGHFL